MAETNVPNDNDATGDCFEKAVHMVLEMGAKARDARVVHGICVGKGAVNAGKTYLHAWVEVGEMVFDLSNGLNVMMPRARYYQLGQVSVTRKYTRFMVRELMIAYQHYGPWEVLGPTDIGGGPIHKAEVQV